MQYNTLVNIDSECVRNNPPHYRRCEAFTISQEFKECNQICEKIEDKAHDILEFFRNYGPSEFILNEE